ncbi:MAG: Tfp pilus assembly protein FimT/FimU [Gammaproteobacteria bacterium]
MMKIKNSNAVLQKGIGLLELMLSLAIIAILLIMATRYYQSASSGQKISEATDMYAAVKSAVNNYFNNTNNTFPTGSNPIGPLVQNDYLPDSYLDGNKTSSTATSNYVNPWGGELTVGRIGTTNMFYVGMTNIPDQLTCNQVVNRIATTLLPANGEGFVLSTTPSGACSMPTNSTFCGSSNSTSATLYVCYSLS